MSDPRSKRTSHFNVLKELQDTDATGKKSHPVTVRKKNPKDPANLTPRDTKDWYFKVMYDPSVPKDTLNHIENIIVAEREVIAQELFRLFIPNYPKTRIVKGSYDRIYVASEGVLNYQAVERMDANDIRQGILDGRYRGLGHTAVMALFCNEIDFKPGNLILSNGRFVKIDGDWCFASLRENLVADDASYKITANNIARLPYCSNYKAYNWLDEIRTDKANTSNILDPRMVDNVYFRQEVNEQLLKIALMPKELLIRFIMGYTNNMMILADLEPVLIERQRQMITAAMQNKDFQAYLQTGAAAKFATEFSHQTVNFVTTGKEHFVVNENKASVIAHMQATFQGLHERVVAEENARMAKLPPVPSKPPPPIPTNNTLVDAPKLPPKPTRPPPPPPTPTAKNVPDSPPIALSAANFETAFGAAKKLRTKSMTTFQPKTMTTEAETLRKQIERASDDNARWKLAEEFTKKNPNDLLTKPLIEVMNKLKNEVGYRMK